MNQIRRETAGGILFEKIYHLYRKFSRQNRLFAEDKPGNFLRGNCEHQSDRYHNAAGKGGYFSSKAALRSWLARGGLFDRFRRCFLGQILGGARLDRNRPGTLTGIGAGIEPKRCCNAVGRGRYTGCCRTFDGTRDPRFRPIARIDLCGSCFPGAFRGHGTYSNAGIRFSGSTHSK